jgi:hypothetical protein
VSSCRFPAEPLSSIILPMPTIALAKKHLKKLMLALDKRESSNEAKNPLIKNQFVGSTPYKNPCALWPSWSYLTHSMHGLAGS